MKNKAETNKKHAKKAAKKVASKHVAWRAAKKAAPKKAAKKAVPKKVASKFIVKKAAAKKAAPKKATKTIVARKAALKVSANQERAASIRKIVRKSVKVSKKNPIIEITSQKTNKMKHSLDEHLQILEADYNKSMEDFEKGKFKVFTAAELIAFISEKSA